MASIYAHTPLSRPRRIRVLQLCLNASETIECELIEISLDRPPQYDALSYTWGAEEPGLHIICQGKQIPVTRNCEAALRVFLQPNQGSLDQAVRSKLLWIDSICINQRDVRERNAQVRMMGDIYARARLVLVWLGSGPENIEQFFKYAQRVTSAIRTEDTAEEESYIYFTSNMEALKKPNMLSVALAIAQNPWFSRVWTVQEVARAKIPIVYCGRDSINWVEFVLLLDKILEGLKFRDASMRLRFLDLRYQLKFHLLIRVRFRNITGEPALVFERKLHDQERGEDPTDLVEPLRALCSCGATDPKDKIFALQSLFLVMGVVFPQVDYNLSLGTIYLEATKALLDSRTSLNVLRYVRGLPNTALDAPSWVPDFSRNPYAWPVEVESQNSDSSTPLFRLSNNGRHLHVRVRFLDEIECSPPFQIWHSDVPLKLSENIVNQTLLSEARTIQTVRALQQWALAARNITLRRKDLSWQDAFLLTLIHEDETDRDSLMHEATAPDTYSVLWCSALLSNTPSPASLFSYPTATTITTTNNNNNPTSPLKALHALSPTTYRLKTFFPKLFSIPLLTPTRITVPSSPPRLPFHPKDSQILHALSSFPPALLASILSVSSHTHFFTTKAARMGVGSAAIQVEDRVVVIRGVTIPMVVRRVVGGEKEVGVSGGDGERVGEAGEGEEERYRLIGPAQILGLDLRRWARHGEVRDRENVDEDVEIMLV